MTTNFNVSDRKHEANMAFEALEKATLATEEALEALNAIPNTGVASWGRGDERKKAKSEYEAAQKAEAEAESLYDAAVEAYEEAYRLQTIADEARAEGDSSARGAMKAAMARILPTEQIEKTGKSAVRKLESLEERAERIRNAKASIEADLQAAKTLGFTGKVAE